MTVFWKNVSCNGGGRGGGGEGVTLDICLKYFQECIWFCGLWCSWIALPIQCLWFQSVLTRYIVISKEPAVVHCCEKSWETDESSVLMNTSWYKVRIKRDSIKHNFPGVLMRLIRGLLTAAVAQSVRTFASHAEG